jgi:signal transduction histidine kinase
MAPGFMAWFHMRSKLPVVVADLAQETRFVPCELLLKHGVKSGIAVPIAGKPRPFGVLEANARQQRIFRDDEVNFVWSVANLLATVIEQRRVAAELREKREQLQTLSRKLIEAQEAERRAVARELHDDFGQVLTALKLNLIRSERDEAESISLVDGAIARMRDLAYDLRPPMLDELGLSASLRWHVEREARRAGLEFQLELAPPEVRWAPTVETTCFRVAQEALTNVIRHGQARRVEVELHDAGGELRLTVRDDGRGFDVSEAHRRAIRGGSQGLLSMHERVALAEGVLEIDSSPGRGTAVHARFPLSAGAVR